MSKTLSKVDQEVTVLLKEIINRKVRKMEAGESSGDDLLGIMLESNGKEIELSTEDIIEECKLFYFAGQETVSAQLLWAMVLLSKHQEWQERAREEVLEVFKKETPDFEDLSRLKIVSSFILRL